jgi:glycosyltransferase involved in cell wall biosynthesis
MRITHLSTTDQAGGAARAAYRLHQGLLKIGCDSKMLVQRKASSDPTVLTFVPREDLGTRIHRAIRGRYLSRNRRRLEALPKGASFLSEDRSEHGADVLRQLPGQEILNLHWIAGFFDYERFFEQAPLGLPIVWTLHDMNPFTGGCHFDGACGKFVDACGACPQLDSTDAHDFSGQCWQRKKTALERIEKEQLHLVSPSQWMAGEARKSSILDRFPLTVIPYSLDTEVFRPHEKQLARKTFDLPADAQIVLFVADSVEEKRKGLQQLLQAIEGMRVANGLCLASLGRGLAFPGGNLPIWNLGYVRDDEKLALAYSAADVFVAPSLQDNFPNTILEAFACGVPVVANAVGGCAEQVQDGVTGMLTKPGDSEHLRTAIISVLDNPELRARMSAACRRTAVEHYGLEIQATRYRELYEKLKRAGQAPPLQN